MTMLAWICTTRRMMRKYLGCKKMMFGAMALFHWEGFSYHLGKVDVHDSRRHNNGFYEL